MHYKKNLLILLFSLFLFSCGSKKKVVSQKEKEQRESIYGANAEKTENNTSSEAIENRPPRNTYANKVAWYIATYAPIAKQEMVLYEIPASITLAQGILESGAGESRLSVKANNHFGIKCHGWEGGRIFHDDDRRQECFRKYKDAKYSYRDHSLFLTGSQRYAGLFDLDIDNYKGWAKGLRKAGYATDRKYPDKLISIIERYNLSRFDAEVMGKEPGQDYEMVSVRNTRGNTSEKYVVQKGDTLYSISRRNNLSVEQLQRYNNLRGSAIDIGQVLYLEPIPNN